MQKHCINIAFVEIAPALIQDMLTGRHRPRYEASSELAPKVTALEICYAALKSINVSVCHNNRSYFKKLGGGLWTFSCSLTSIVTLV